MLPPLFNRRYDFSLNPIMASLFFALLSPTSIALAAQKADAQEQLETVVVTARKSEELAKDLPFSLTVLDEETLNQRGFKNFEEVLRATPGVMVYSTGGANQSNIIIRGVGALSPVSMDDSSVVLNVDGVSLSSRDASLATLDMQQIEVLKGPQGTLYGRNSAAGAINVTTNKPTDYLESNLKVEVGDNQQYLGELMVSGPLSDSVKARVALRGTTKEHWVNYAESGEPITDIDEFAARASLIWDINADNQLYLVAENNQVKDDANLFVLRPYASSPTVNMEEGQFNNNKKSSDRYSIKWSSELANSRFESISAYTKSGSFAAKIIGKDVSQALGQGAIESAFEEDLLEKTVSQEFRLLSKPESDLFWVTGVNYYHSQRSFDTDYPAFGTRQQRNYETTNYALYGEMTYPLTSKLSLTGGARYTIDNKEYDAGYFNSLGGITPDARDIDDHYTTGRLALSYALTDATNLYTSLARGYKTGGVSDYPSQIIDSEPYKASEINAVEVGFKMAPTQARYSLTGALFFNQVHDERLLGFDYSNYATTVINADTETRGIELVGKLQLGHGITFDAGINYTDAEITSNALGVVGGDVNVGNKVPDVANWNSTVGVSWLKQLPSFMGLNQPMLNSNLAWRYVGDRPADAQNNFDLDAYHKIDARLSLEFDNAVVYLWGQNLLDQQYDLYAYKAGQGVAYGAPSKRRSFGIGFKYSY